MKITDRRSSAKAWYEGEFTWDDGVELKMDPIGLEGMTVHANEDTFDDSGLLGPDGEPLGRRRRGPGFGIYSR